MPQEVLSQPGNDVPPDRLVEPCPQYAVIEVVLTFGPGEAARDGVTVQVARPEADPVQPEQQSGNRWAFRVDTDATYDVTVGGPLWFSSAKYVYRAAAQRQRHTGVAINVYTPAIRFVRGQDGTALQALAFSRQPTNTGLPGADVHTLADQQLTDPDIFQVELSAPTEAGDELAVALEALRPTYPGEATLYDPRAPNGWVSFPAEGGVRAARSLDLVAARIGDSVVFRTCGVRLVADRDDKAAVPAQALLVTDMVDLGDPLVEILDQKVRASAGGLEAEAPVGTDRKRIKLSVRILRSGVWAQKQHGHATDHVRRTRSREVAPVDATLAHTLKLMRRVYAQASMSVKLDRAPQVVAYPSNVLRIGRPPNQGLGDYVITVTLQPSRTAATYLLPDLAVSVTVGAQDSAAVVAGKIGAAITARVQDFNNNTGPPNLPRRSWHRYRNAASPHGQQYPAYAVAVHDRDPKALLVVGAVAEVAGIQAQPSRANLHALESGAWADATLPEESNGHDTNAYEDALIATYRTAGHIDVVVVGGLEGHGSTYPAHNYCLVLARCINERGHYVRTLPHEVMHALAECGHPAEPTDLMHTEMNDAAEIVDDEASDGLRVGGPKRIHDTVQYVQQWGHAQMGLSEPKPHFTLLRTAHPELLADW